MFTVALIKELIAAGASVPPPIDPRLVSLAPGSEIRVVGNPQPGTIRSGGWKKISASQRHTAPSATHWRSLRLKALQSPKLVVCWDYSTAPDGASDDEAWWHLSSTRIIFSPEDGKLTTGSWSRETFTYPDQALDPRHYFVPFERTPAGPRTKIAEGGVPALLAAIEGKTTLAASATWGQWTVLCDGPDGSQVVDASNIVQQKSSR